MKTFHDWAVRTNIADHGRRTHTPSARCPEWSRSASICWRRLALRLAMTLPGQPARNSAGRALHAETLPPVWG